MNLTDLILEKGVKVSHKDALIVVDVQNDFIPGGALPVNDGHSTIPDINSVAERFKKNKGIVVLTQDWHPKNHASFASNHPGKKPGDLYQDEGVGPILWPDHCVQGSKGAEFHPFLKSDLANAIVRKGLNPAIDSYSGFLENDKKSETGLAGYLKSLKIESIFVCGLALDYCCYYTAMDGDKFGFKVYFLAELTKGIDLPPGNISNALDSMIKASVKFANKNSFA